MDNTDLFNYGTQKYLKSLKGFKSLSKEEERKLLEEYKLHNDLKARNKLIESNLKYACQIANTYRGRGLDFNDLICEANNGLIEAIDKYDLSQDVKLITFSRWIIIKNMQEALKNENRLINNNDEINVTEDDILNIGQIDDNSEEDDYETFNGTFTNIEETLNVLMEDLTDREREIITLYYGINGNQKINLNEIGKKYHITKERTRQIMEKAMLKIRTRALSTSCTFLR